MNSVPLPAAVALTKHFRGSKCYLAGGEAELIRKKWFLTQIKKNRESLLQVLRLRGKTRFILNTHWKRETILTMWGKLSKIHVYYLKSNLTNLKQCPKQVQSFRNVKRNHIRALGMWKEITVKASSLAWMQLCIKALFSFSFYFFRLLCNCLQKNMLLALAALGTVVEAKAVYVRLFRVFCDTWIT